MTKEEFATRMRDLGWDKDFIDLKIRRAEEFEKQGLEPDYEIHLFEAPEPGYPAYPERENII